MKWVLAAVGVLLAVGVALWFTGVLKLPVPPPHWKAAAPKSVLVALPQMTSNLASGSGSHFVEVTMTVKLRNSTDAKALAKDNAATQNAVLAALRTETVQALDAPGGMAALQSKLGSAVDQAIAIPHAVEAVYFTQFLVD